MQDRTPATFSRSQSTVASLNFLPSFPFHFPFPELLESHHQHPKLTSLHASLCIRPTFRLRHQQMSGKFLASYISSSSVSMTPARYVLRHIHILITVNAGPAPLCHNTGRACTEGRITSQCHSHTGIASNNYTSKRLQAQTKCIPSSTSPQPDSKKCLGPFQHHETQEGEERVVQSSKRTI